MGSGHDVRSGRSVSAVCCCRFTDQVTLEFAVGGTSTSCGPAWTCDGRYRRPAGGLVTALRQPRMGFPRLAGAPGSVIDFSNDNDFTGVARPPLGGHSAPSIGDATLTVRCVLCQFESAWASIETSQRACISAGAVASSTSPSHFSWSLHGLPMRSAAAGRRSRPISAHQLQRSVAFECPSSQQRHAAPAGRPNGPGFGWQDIDVFNLGVAWAGERCPGRCAPATTRATTPSGRRRHLQHHGPGRGGGPVDAGLRPGRSTRNPNSRSRSCMRSNRPVTGTSLFAGFGAPSPTTETIQMKQYQLGIAYVAQVLTAATRERPRRGRRRGFRPGPGCPARPAAWAC